MKFGELEFMGVEGNEKLLSVPTRQGIEQNNLTSVLVTAIDPGVSDTAAFCEKYKTDAKVCANCIVVKASRGDVTRYAAVMIDGESMADINGVVRRHLDARKISFAPMSETVEITGMEFGAINPIGLPADWLILVDAAVAKLDKAIIGSGIRESKLLVSGELLASLPNATVLDMKKAPMSS